MKSLLKLQSKRIQTPYLLIFLALISMVFISNFHAVAWPVKTYKELRYEHVKKQNTLSSCGPSSLATLFSEFYEMKVSEEKIIELIKPYLDEEIEKLKEGEVPEGGVSMLDLKRVSKELGVQAKGYEIPEEKLLTIIRKVKSPLLIYLEEPEDHFVLSIAGDQGKVILADPMLGTRYMSLESLFDKWKGLVLAFSPGDEYGNIAHKITKEVRQNFEKRSLTEDLAREFL